MLSKKLKDLKKLDVDFEVIISTSDECAYFIEIRQGQEILAILDKHDEPIHYSSLDEVYEILKKYHIEKAILRQSMPYDEMIGTGSDSPQIVEMEVKVPQ